MNLLDRILGKEPRGAWFWLIAFLTLFMLFAPRCAHAQFAECLSGSPFGGQGNEQWLVPRYVIQNVEDGSLVDSECAGSFLKANAALCVDPPNFSNILFCKLMGWMALSMRRPSLRNHITLICETISKKQVLGVNTERIVAFVQDERTSRNFSVVNHPRYPVRLNPLGIIKRKCNENPTIRPFAFMLSTDPLPAPNPLDNLVPKPDPNRIADVRFSEFDTWICHSRSV